MAARLLALLIALSTSVTGILPAGDGCRCLMDKPIVARAACCPKCDVQPLTIGAPCCEVVHGAVLDARSDGPVPPPRIGPAPLLAISALAAAATPDVPRQARRIASLPRGQPAGERLARLSTILRI